jgi:TonB family protein
MDKNEKKDKGIAIGGTILVHSLAVLILFLMAFRTPLPLPGEEGVEVDLGMMDQGMGNIQPEKPAVPQAAAPQPKQEKSEEENLTQNDEEAPAIDQPKTPKPKPQEKPIDQPPQPKVNDRALYKGSNTSQAGGSEGITGQPGDQGNSNGIADVRQYDGNGGSDNGTGYDLGGRGAKSLHSPDDDFTEEGTIVIDIWVNPDGQVVRAEVATKGTTIINNLMRQKAKQAALRSTFVADPNANKEQHGTITYTFVIKK